MRRAAEHLRGRTASPLADLPPDDEELARTVSELVSMAGRMPEVSRERLEYNRLVLEYERLGRAILRARADGGGGGSDLAVARERVLEALRKVEVDTDE